MGGFNFGDDGQGDKGGPIFFCGGRTESTSGSRHPSLHVAAPYVDDCGCGAGGGCGDDVAFLQIKGTPWGGGMFQPDS